MHRLTMPDNALGFQHQSGELGLHAACSLGGQRRATHEIAFLRFPAHRPSQIRHQRAGAGVHVLTVKTKARLKPQGIAGTKANRFHIRMCQKRLGDVFGPVCGYRNLEPVLARITRTRGDAAGAEANPELFGESIMLPHTVPDSPLSVVDRQFGSGFTAAEPSSAVIASLYSNRTLSQTERATLVVPKDRAQDIKKLHDQLPESLRWIESLQRLQQRLEQR